NQSGAILLYLAEKTGKLVPKDPAGRALAYQWMMLSLTDVAPASSGIFYATMLLPDKPAAAASFFETRFLDLCRVVDRRLGAAAYLAGSELSIADVALYPVIAGRQAVMEKADGLANLKGWAAALAARPTVERALKVAA
ncbi:MAG TPA: glutathione S-transferase family protein, partial [Alphaproteobacteria bacterium]|nr:glutathione S-transferase family protein [Alphaproteobacteria bacterium]